ncbi:MAG: cupredoxin domain-containing protein [Actinomycetota bacterium]
MNILRRFLAPALAASLLVFLTPSDVLAATATIKTTSKDKWKPFHTYIGKGDTVIWKNTDSVKHDMTSYGGGWNHADKLSPGEKTSFRFTKVDTFKYRCKIHSGIVDGKCQGMCGLVHVFN